MICICNYADICLTVFTVILAPEEMHYIQFDQLYLNTYYMYFSYIMCICICADICITAFTVFLSPEETEHIQFDQLYLYMHHMHFTYIYYMYLYLCCICITVFRLDCHWRRHDTPRILADLTN